MKILIDSFGGDQGLDVTVEAALKALEERDFTPCFVGDREEILKRLPEGFTNYEIIEAKTNISNDQDPVSAIRKNKDSSMVVGLQKLNEEGYDGFISAGSTGALLAGGLLISKRIKGIKRACLAASLPSKEGVTLLMDSGANVDCKPEFLRDFAIMGTIFLESVLGIENPRVGLLNIGEEEHKGNALTKKANELLKAEDLNYVGNVESREIFSDQAEIILADGFDGNLVVKACEGLLSLVKKELKAVVSTSTKAKIGAGLLMGPMKKELSSYKLVSGAPLLGVKKYVYKSHGNSSVDQYKDSILDLCKYIDSGAIGKIEKKMEERQGQEEKGD